ncbi:hypothetical protein M2366_000830 [Aeromonas sp. BIGb0405]|nr:hypothetical protein [Aeromonas sp. BIGb0405]MCS3454791.1 hypothetical protein [Aeromonas sp. BIGb0405]
MKLDQLPMPAPQLLMGIEAFMVNLPFIEIPLDPELPNQQEPRHEA